MEQCFLYFWKRRKFFLINLIAISLISIGYAFFLVKKEYKAQMTFLPPSGESTSPAASILGIQLPSLSGSQVLTEQISTIFDSKAIKRQIIEEFNLYKTFKLEKSVNKFELANKRLQKYVTLETNEKGGMGFEKIISYSIVCYHPSPDSAKQICLYAFSLLDSAVKSISMDRAHRNRVFVETQVAFHNHVLDSLQKVFEEFQITNKAFVIPDQLKLSLKAYSEIKSAAVLNDLKIKALQQDLNGDVPEIDELRKNNALYNQKLAQMESATSPDVLPSLGLSVKLLPRYANLMRETEVQNQVILMLAKELEQARLQESKNVSSLIVVDPPYVPEYKARPKRMLVLLTIIVIENLFLFLLFSYRFYFSTVVMNHAKVKSLLQAIKSSKR